MKNVMERSRRRSYRSSFCRAGFTLIELLVVVAIIVMLIAILLPSLGRSREQSRQVVCGVNVKQLVTGMLIYADENGTVLPYCSAQSASLGTMTWDLLIHAILNGQQRTDYELSHYGTPTHPKSLRCPSDNVVRPSWAGANAFRSYSMPAYGQGGIGMPGIPSANPTLPVTIKTTMIANMQDTIALAENHWPDGPGDGTPIPNIAGNTSGAGVERPADQGPSANARTVNPIPMIHNGKFTYGFADGHVEVLVPTQVSRKPSTCNAWGTSPGVGGKWVWNTDLK